MRLSPSCCNTIPIEMLYHNNAAARSGGRGKRGLTHRTTCAAAARKLPCSAAGMDEWARNHRT
eukprot:scaffold843_cov327-Prasinococcus_capsulatus_cf.AAC.20